MPCSRPVARARAAAATHLSLWLFSEAVRAGQVLRRCSSERPDAARRRRPAMAKNEAKDGLEKVRRAPRARNRRRADAEVA